MIPAGVEHRLRDLEPSVLRILCLAPAFVAGEPGVLDIWTRLARTSSPLLQVGSGWQLRLESHWHRALVEQVNKAVGYAALLRTVALQVLVQLARLPAGGGGGAAAAAHMSRRSFSAHFHRRTGRTFLAHLTALRLEHAARLLAQGNHSIVGAALAAGYRDVSHFHRLWRRHYGTTPKAWARGR